METINTIELTDENTFPDKSVLKKVLGRSYNAYVGLLKLYDNNDLAYEWRYYRDGKAWLCKVQKKKRTIVWMSAWKGYMQATIYFPERYIDDIFKLSITDDTKDIIQKTKNVGKSKPCIFEIRNKKALGDLEKVMKFKILTK
jgi:lipopolysaccharide biosynthesis glycosyltransferase